MNNTKRFLSLCWVFILFININAQDLVNRVPQSAIIAGMFNLNQVDSKASFAELIELPLFKDLDEEIGKELFNGRNEEKAYLQLSNYGIDYKQKAYAYGAVDDIFYYGGLLFSINDTSKFAALARQLMHGQKAKWLKVDDLNLLEIEKLKVLWNVNEAFVFAADLNPAYEDSISKLLEKKYNYNDYSYDYEDIEEALAELEKDLEDIEETTTDEPALIDTAYIDIEFDEEAVEEENPKELSWYEFKEIKNAYKDSISDEWVRKNLKVFLADKGAKSILADKVFRKQVKSSPDALFYFDYENLYRDFIGSFLLRAPAYTLGMPNMKGAFEIYRGTKLYANLNIEQNEVVADIHYIYGKELQDIYKEIHKKRVPKKYLKYMQKDLMGYYALSFDVEGVANGMKDIWEKTYSDIPKYGKIMVSAIDVAEIVVNEKSIYNVFSGDLIFAVNGVKEFESIYKSYDYDEEFNRIETVDTVMKKMPDLLIMAGIGNEADVQKIANLLVHTKVFKKENNLYTLTYEKGFPLYFSIHNKILFIGNNKAMIQHPDDFASKSSAKEHSKRFKRNNMVVFANTAEIARYFADTEKESFESQKMLIETSNLFKSAEFQGQSKRKQYNAKYIMNLTNSKENAIMDVFRFFNKLYLINEKKI